jgi:transcriptional regulator with XRE-family HTH domain
MTKNIKPIHSAKYGKLIEMLVELRKDAGITQRDLARSMGVHHSWVAKVEICERRLDVVEFIRLIKTLGGDPVKMVKEISGLIK